MPSTKHELVVFIILLFFNFIRSYKTYKICHERSTCVNQDHDVNCNNSINHCVKKFYNESTIDPQYWQNSIFFRNVNNNRLTYRIKIKPFLNCETRNELKLNITFSNISWQSLYLYYKQENNQNSSRYQIFCIGNSSKISSIREFFATRSLEANSLFFLELRANYNDYTEVRKFKFQMPVGYLLNEKYNINKRKLFLYLDVSDLNNKVILYISTLSFNSCLVEVYKENEKTEDDKLTSKYFKMNDIIDEEIEFVYNINRFYPGTYYFVVWPIDQSCLNGTCSANYSPKIYIDSSYVIVVLQTLLFIILLMVPISICLCCYLSRKGYIPKSVNVLLISTTVHQNHSAVVQEFITRLKKLHIITIESSHIKGANPAEWCNNVFKIADIVVVIAAPNIIKCESEVHRNVENIFINLITIELAKTTTTKKFCLIKFPYCVGNSIQKQVENFEQFAIVSDFNKFIAFINNEKYFCFNMLSNSYTYKRDLMKLTILINEADAKFKSEVHNIDNVQKSIISNVQNDVFEIENVNSVYSSIKKHNQTLFDENEEKSEVLKVSSVQESGFDINSLNLTGMPEVEKLKSNENNRDNFEINIRNLIL